MYSAPPVICNRSPPMQESMRSPQSSTAPSVWVNRFLPLIKPGGLVLDVAAGNGRHVRLLRDRGFAVCAVDRDTTALLAFVGPRCEVRRIDLETDDSGQLGDDYDEIIVTNYLHRPLLPAIARALAPGGVLIYETFARGNERFGRPASPDFLLEPRRVARSLLTTLTVVAFEQGEVSVPRPAVIQRLAAVLGPMGPLPETSRIRSRWVAPQLQRRKCCYCSAPPPGKFGRNSGISAKQWDQR